MGIILHGIGFMPVFMAIHVHAKRYLAPVLKAFMRHFTLKGMAIPYRRNASKTAVKMPYRAWHKNLPRRTGENSIGLWKTFQMAT